MFEIGSIFKTYDINFIVSRTDYSRCALTPSGRPLGRSNRRCAGLSNPYCSSPIFTMTFCRYQPEPNINVRLTACPLTGHLQR